jgi:hypothetical protein
MMISILTGLRKSLNVVLVCISLMAKNIEHFFHVFISHLYFCLLRGPIQLIYPLIDWIIGYFVLNF